MRQGLCVAFVLLLLLMRPIVGFVYELGHQLGTVGKRRDRREFEIAKVNNEKKIHSLKKQHAELEELLRTAPTDYERKKLKSEKLSVKDQISKLTAKADTATKSAADSTGVLGSGTSGKVYYGTNSQTKQRVAIKTAVSPAQQDELRREYLVLEKLSTEACGFPRPHLYCQQVILDTPCSVLVMDLLGPSVESLLFTQTLGTRGFEAPTVLHIARDALKRLQTLSNHGLVHSDVHPGNLLMGASAASNRTVYLIDYGKSRLATPAPRGSFRGVFDNFHKNSDGEAVENSAALPSLLFASSDVLAGRSPRGRDDVEALLFSLASLSAGNVPENYWGRSRAEVVRAKAGQCYSISDLLSVGGTSEDRVGGGGGAVEHILELMKAQVRHGSGPNGRVDYEALTAAVDDALGGGRTVLDWEAEGIFWDEASHVTTPYG